MGWKELAVAALKFFGFIAEDVGKQQDANAASVVKQSGVDAEKATSLEKSVEIARAQTAAVIDAPTDQAGTIGDMRKGGF